MNRIMRTQSNFRLNATNCVRLAEINTSWYYRSYFNDVLLAVNQKCWSDYNLSQFPFFKLYSVKYNMSTSWIYIRFRCQYFSRNRKKCLSPELDSFVTQQLYHQERVLWWLLFSLSLFFNKILKMLHTHAALKFIATKWLGYWKWNVFDNILFTQLEQQHDFLSRVYPSAYLSNQKNETLWWWVSVLSLVVNFSSKVSISQVGHLAQAVIVFK